MLRNRIIMIIFIILTGVFATFYGGAVPYTLFTLALLLPLLSLIYLVFVYLNFRIYQLIDRKTIVKYERTPFRFILANESIITYAHINVSFLSDYSTLEQVDIHRDYSLLPDGRVEHETALTCRYRGDYFVGIDKVFIQDYLHLFRISYQCPSKIEVHVLPRVLHAERISILPPEEDAKHQPQNRNAQSPDAETRNYVNGDSLRLIHWKASAKQGSLLTRKQLTEPKPEQIVFLDLSLPEVSEYDRVVLSDRVIECVLAIADYYLRNHTPCSVFCYSGKQTVFPIHSTTEFEGFYQFCCQVAFRNDETCAKLMEATAAMVGSGASCTLVTTMLSSELAFACQHSINTGNRISLLYIGDEETEYFSSALDQRINLIRIDTRQDLLTALDT